MADENKRGEKLVTMKMPEKVHTAIKILQRRYKTETLGEGLWAFLEDKDSSIPALVDSILDELEKQKDPFDIAGKGKPE